MVRGMVVVPHVLVRGEVCVLLQAAAARHVPEPVALGAVPAAAVPAAAAAEHRAHSQAQSQFTARTPSQVAHRA
jgi:hypothetical protein